MRTLGWVTLGGLVVAVGAGVGAAFAERGERWHDGRGHHGWHHDGYHHGRGHGDGDHRGGWWRGSREVTKDDAAERARARFARLDANGDAVIDRSEVEAMVDRRMERRGGADKMVQRATRQIMRLDENRDGKVTREEAINEVTDRFDRFDLNGDGQISDPDLPPMMRGVGALKSDGGPGPWMRRGGGRMLGVLRQANTNNDDVVTREEAVAFAEQQFTRFDRNSDGTLDNADAEAFKTEMRAYRVDRFLNRFDAVQSGTVSREAFLQQAQQRFERRDLNGDGTITRDERHGGRWMEPEGRGEHGRGERQGDGPGRGDGGRDDADPAREL